MVPSNIDGDISKLARPFSTVTVPHAVFESQVAVSCPSGVIVRLNGSTSPQCPGVTVPVHVPAMARIPSIGVPVPACNDAQPAMKMKVAARRTEPSRVMESPRCCDARARPRVTAGPRLYLSDAAIHEQLRSRDVAGVVGGEKHHGLGDLLGS